MLLIGLGAITLSGCSKANEGLNPSAHGRYAGVGLYPAGRMWRQLVREGAAKDSTAAVLQDDEQIIVVLDSNTGEVRQCGNLSGHCLSMRPWGASPAPSAPATVLKHAADLDTETQSQTRQAKTSP